MDWALIGIIALGLTLGTVAGLAVVVFHRQWSAHRLEVRRTRVLLAHERWEKEMNRERRRQQRRRYLGGRK